MIVLVLGSAAGGGFPQWNCDCRNCARVRTGEPGLRARTQSSLAVSADGHRWAVLNASPDIRQQIAATPSLAPVGGGLRGSPIEAVVLTNGDVDHIAGLLSLREAQPFAIYAGERVLDTLAANPVFNVLARGVVERRVLPLGGSVHLRGAASDLGLSVEAFGVPGKIALYLEDAAAGPGFGTREGDTIGVKVTAPASGRSFYYVPGCAAVDETLAGRLRGADLVFFDGTLFSDDEMVAQGLGPKTGQRMGHISIAGPGGSIAAFRDLGVKRRIYVHINNSNPVLDECSPARAEVESAGWEVAYDGMEVRL